jgi:spore coat polysaccharide biosynthesis protein SpsF
MKTCAIIEARMTSTRLPGKILLPVMGKPLLELLVERLKCVHSLDEIIVATTVNPTDDVVETLTRKIGVGCFRGSEDDVLCRVLGAAKKYRVDVIVEVTGDCPLIDPEIVEKLIGIYREGNFDYVSNVLKPTYPVGMDTQVFSTEVLQKVADLTRDPIDHEHVSLYIYEHPELFSLYNHESGLPEKYGNLRLTLDTSEDFALIRSVYESLYPKKPRFLLQDILELLLEHDELLAINRHISQKKVR